MNAKTMYFLTKALFKITNIISRGINKLLNKIEEGKKIAQKLQK